jgi:putative phage-type endonuclease
MTDERDRFLAERREGIGGSDIAAIMGQNPYKTAHDVYLDKIGERADEPPSPAMQRGLALEPLIADWYARTTGRIVKRERAFTGLHVHAEYPEFRVHVDAIVTDTRKGSGIAEFKAPGFRNYGAWKLEGLPIYYYMQLQWGIGIVPERQFGSAAFFSAELWDGIHFDVGPDTELILRMQDAALRFWKDHVEARVPPPMDAEPVKVEVPPTLVGTELTLLKRREDLVWCGAANILLEARQIATDALAYREAVEDQVKNLMGDDQIVEGGGIRIYYRHQDGRKTIDVKAVQAANPLDFDKVLQTLHECRLTADEINRVLGCRLDFSDYEKIAKASRPFRVYQVAP